MVDILQPVPEQQKITVPDYDPYPQFRSLAQEWAEAHATGEVLFGTLIDAPPYSTSLESELVSIFQHFGLSFDHIQRMRIGDDDRSRFPILGNANAWAKSIPLPQKDYLLIFYSDRFEQITTQNDQHEVLHLPTDRITQRIVAVREPFENNPILYPNFAPVTRFEDHIREGTVMLLESQPAKATQDEIQIFLSEHKPQTVSQALDVLKSLLISPDSKDNPSDHWTVQIGKEISQHVVVAYVRQFAPETQLSKLAQVLNAVSVQDQRQFYTELMSKDPTQFLVKEYITTEDRNIIFRDKLVKK